MAPFTVIGLGRFGLAASLELINLGHTVTGVDSDRRIVEKHTNLLSEAVICDSTDETALRELDLESSNAVLVAIGEDMQSSILCTLSLKNMGIDQIWVKASNKAHHTIISKLGVSRIIHPEEEMGIRVAQALNYPMVNDYISLGNNFFIVEVFIKAHLQDATINFLLNDTRHLIEPVMVKRGKEITHRPAPQFTLQEHDILLLCGTRAELSFIAPRLL